MNYILNGGLRQARQDVVASLSNEDIDKLDLDVLDLKTEISDDSELFLDIEELK
jgi:hypothetical protein